MSADRPGRGNKIPTRLKVLRGNPGKRPLNTEEPQPTLGVPDAPDFLDAEARAEWDRVAPELGRLGLVALIDRAALAAYCQCWSTYRAAEKWLQENGAVSGGQIDPMVKIRKEALDDMRRYGLLFGLSPSGRVHLKVEKQKKAADEFSEFLKLG